MCLSQDSLDARIREHETFYSDWIAAILINFDDADP